MLLSALLTLWDLGNCHFYQAWVNYINKLKIYFILQYSLICDEKYIYMHIVSLKYENILYITWIWAYIHNVVMTRDTITIKARGRKSQYKHLYFCQWTGLADSYHSIYDCNFRHAVAMTWLTLIYPQWSLLKQTSELGFWEFVRGSEELSAKCLSLHMQINLLWHTIIANSRAVQAD